MRTDLSRNDPVDIKFGSRWIKDARVLGIYDFQDAVKAEKNGNEYIVKPDEVRTLDERLAEERRKEDERNQEVYGDLIAAWKEGKRTHKELAEATNTSMRGIAGRIRAAKRRGLLA